MTRYIAIICPFVLFIFVQGQELLFHVDKIQIRTLAGPFEDITQRNLAVFLTKREYFDLGEIERTPEDVLLLRRQILSFDIFDISVMPLNRLVIQAFERKTANNYFMYLHCTISEPVDDGILNVVHAYRTLKGITPLPLPMYKLSKVWKYEGLGVNNSRIELMNYSFVHIEEVFNVDGSRMGCRRFTIKSADDRRKWIIFSSHHFGLYPVATTNRIFIVISELAGTDDAELLHYYAVDISPHFLAYLHDNLGRDAKPDLTVVLADKLEPMLRINKYY